MRVVAVVGLVVLISLLAQLAVSQVPDDRLIVPGVRVGKWTLEMTVEELIAALGRPTRILSGRALDNENLRLDLQLDLRSYRWQRDGLYAYTKDDRNVLLLEAEGAPEFVTDKGVKSGVSRADAEGAYGRPTRVTQARAGRGMPVLQYNEIGLEVYLATMVLGIGVFRPGTASSIWRP